MEIAGWVFAVILGLLWWFSTSAKGSSTPTMTAADAAELDKDAPASSASAKPRSDSAMERQLKETQAILRRRERDTQVQVEQAIDGFARELLPVDEALERALQAEGDVDAYREGMSLVQRLMRNAFERSGLVPILPEPGARFDPKLHHGIAQEPNDHGRDESECALEVVSVERTGWLLHSRLIQAADVVVRLVPNDDDAAAPAGDDTPSADAAEGHDEAAQEATTDAPEASGPTDDDAPSDAASDAAESAQSDDAASSDEDAPAPSDAGEAEPAQAAKDDGDTDAASAVEGADEADDAAESPEVAPAVAAAASK